MFGQNINVRFGGPLTPVVKGLMIANGGVFLVQQIMNLIFPGTGVMESMFGLSYSGLVEGLKIWQVFTYMFLHGGWLHIIFNLITLWMFAGELEQTWGSRYFLRFYLLSGVGAGIFISLMNFYLRSQYPLADPVTLGASGALYGILLAYGMMWPNREVLVYFLFPVKIKYMVLVFGLIEFFSTLSSASGGGGSGISHIGHLGGLITGFLLIYLHRTANRAPSRSAKPGGLNFVSRWMKRNRLEKKKKQIDERIKAKRIIDDLLEKIARSGMSSLSPEERKSLEWARRHYYPDKTETLH